MTFIKEADVKNHLSARHRTENHLSRPESQPDATGFAGAGSESADPQMKDLAVEQLDQLAPIQLDSASNVTSPDSSQVAAPATSKSARL
jgi:hypothetical protein